MLPKLEVPVYELKLPSTNKTIRYHPFTVKEKKLFLLVKESNEVKDIVDQIKQVIRNCIVSPTNVDVDEMPIIDIEYLFVHLRARSEGEVQEVTFICRNEVDGKECGAESKASFNMLDVKIEKEEGHTNKIALTDKIGVCMKYPTYAMSQLLIKDNVSETDIVDMMADCIEYVYDENKMYYAKDEKKEDLMAWFQGLTEANFQKIGEFFDKSPKIIAQSHFKCNKCNHEEDIKLQGIQDFFQ